MLRALLLVTSFVASLAGSALAQQATNFPTKPVRLITPYAPGGGGDMIARLVAQGLSERLGRQVAVDNRLGAGGIIAYEIVVKAPADGYTLLLAGSSLAFNPAIRKKVPYDVMRDFAPITQAVLASHLIVAHPSVPVKTVKEMIAFTKARPGQVLYASAGVGSATHLIMELFSSMAQIRMIHVPYKGVSPGVIDLIAGEVALSAPAIPTAIPHVRAGRLRALGVTGASRVAAMPDIPTIAEGGLPGYEANTWYGLLAPAGTPQDIIARLHEESVAILHAPDSKKRIAGDGAEVGTSSPEEFATFIKAETVKWANVAKAAGITPE